MLLIKMIEVDEIIGFCAVRDGSDVLVNSIDVVDSWKGWWVWVINGFPMGFKSIGNFLVVSNINSVNFNWFV